MGNGRWLMDSHPNGAISHYPIAITLAACCEQIPIMKQLFLTFSLIFIALSSCANPETDASKGGKSPKYIFYFISDGTGLNIVQAAEHYRADIKGYTSMDELKAALED